MSVLARLAISLPVAVGAWMVGTNAMTASASQEIAPAKALELLARSRAVDAKCSYLTISEHQELNDYVAKAEISTASREGPETATKAVRTGISQGAAMDCGRDSEIVVRATMDAARRAMEAVRQQASEQVRQAARKTQDSTDRSATSRREIAKRKPASSNEDLRRYTSQAAAYYVERRCRHLSQGDVMSFWRKVAARHNKMLELYGPDAVRQAKNDAISASKRTGGCNGRTVNLVKAGYASIRSN